MSIVCIFFAFIIVAADVQIIPLSIISNSLLYNISEYLLFYNKILYYKLYFMLSFWL